MSEKKEPLNILKVRDDHGPLQFAADGDNFRLQPGKHASWLKSDEFDQKDLRNRIEPWLTSLVQSEHLSLLIGSGITHAVHRIATGSGAYGMDRSGYDFGDLGERKPISRMIFVLRTNYCVAWKSPSRTRAVR